MTPLKYAPSEAAGAKPQMRIEHHAVPVADLDMIEDVRTATYSSGRD